MRCTRTELPEEVQPTFDAQVDAINRVQRGPEWNEIAFYRMRRGGSNWSNVPLLPRLDECPIAEVCFRADGSEYKARLTAIGGHIFDFAITPGPREAAFAEWESEPQITLLSDLRDSIGSPTEEPVPGAWRELVGQSGWDELRGWIIHEPSRVYRVVLGDGEFLLLAEREGRDFLLYRLNPRPNDYFLQLASDGQPEWIGGDFSAWPPEAPSVALSI